MQFSFPQINVADTFHSSILVLGHINTMGKLHFDSCMKLCKWFGLGTL